MLHNPWNVLLCHLNGEWTMSERWVNGERTLKERWGNAEWKMSERLMKLVNDMWTLNDEQMRNANRGKRESNVNGERTMNAQWTFYSESLKYFPCIVLNLKFGKNLHV